MADLKALARENGIIRDTLDADRLLIGGIDFGIAGGVLTLGTVNATALSIGAPGVVTTVLGDLSVNGIFTIVDGGSMIGDGDITLGGGDGDTITLGGSWVSADDIVNIGTVNGVHNTTVNLRCTMGVNQDKRINFDRTADSEGALLIPDTKDAPVGLAKGMIRVNAAGAFEWYTGAAWAASAVIGVYTLDDAYNASAGAALIAQDAGDVTWDIAGDYSFIIDTTHVSHNLVDGFIVTDAGTDYFNVLHSGAGSLALQAQVGLFDVDSDAAITIDCATAGISLDSKTSSNFTVTANSAGAEVLQLFCLNAGVGTGSVGISADDDVDITATNGTLTLHGKGGAAGVAIEATNGGGSIDIGVANLTNQINIGTAGVRLIQLGFSGSTGTTVNGMDVGIIADNNDALAHALTIRATNVGAGTAIINIDAKSAITIDTAAGFSIDGISASNVSATTGTLDITTTSGTLTVDATAGLVYVGTGAAGGTITFGNLLRRMGVNADVYSLSATGLNGNLQIQLSANVAALRDLQLDCDNVNALGARITFSDSWQKDSAGAGGYSVAMPFGTTAAEWTSFKTNFGDGTSLLAAANACSPTAIGLAGLTPGRVVIVGAGPTLSDSANLSFNGTDLNVIGKVTLSSVTVAYYPIAIVTGTLIFGNGGTTIAAGANDCTVVGLSALAGVTTGSGNTAVGKSAGYNSSTGTNNVFIGMESGYGSGGVYTGANSNVCVGYRTGYTFANSSINNVLIGGSAGRLYAGSGLTAIGASALEQNTGVGNTAIGYVTGYRSTTGTYNVFIGYESGFGSINPYTGANYNVCVGYRSGYDFGGAALNNTLLGAYSGENITTGDGNVCIGYQAGSALTTESNKLYIANSNAGVGATLIVGDFSTGNIGFGLSAWGTSAANVIGIASGTAPTTSPANAIQLWSLDDADGSAALNIRTEGGELYQFGTKVGLGTNTPSSKVDIEYTGTATSDVDFLEITNMANAAAMTNTRTTILFNQWYYDAVTPAVADAAKITVGTEGNWTSAVADQDSYMAFLTALNGTIRERWRIASTGALSNTSAMGTAYIHLAAGTATASEAPIKLTDGAILATKEAGAIEFYKTTLWMTTLVDAANNVAWQSLDGTLFAQTDPETVAATATETTLVGTGRGSATLPISFFALAGKSIRVTARGYFTSIVNSTLALRVYLKDDAAASCSCVTTDLATGLRADCGWEVQVIFTCYSTGGAGEFWGQGFAKVASSATATDVIQMVNTAHAHLDTTDHIDVDVTADWNSAGANSITCTNLIVESLD